MKNQKGISLLEILVVVSIFAVLGILVTRSVLLTLGGGKKSETVIKIRENLNYSVGVMERQLRNANSISDCTNANTSVISYLDQNDVASTFSCLSGYVASGSAKLTNDNVKVTSCSFTCVLGSTGPSSVKIDLEATDAQATGLDNTIISTSTQVFLRNY